MRVETSADVDRLLGPDFHNVVTATMHYYEKAYNMLNGEWGKKDPPYKLTKKDRICLQGFEEVVESKNEGGRMEYMRPKSGRHDCLAVDSTLIVLDERIHGRCRGQETSLRVLRMIPPLSRQCLRP